ncbi:uncharacterized protein VTP21DRAFT_7789 [Calcarisporiella thermophila]|uniref:uncharacterized protein n=1 Tax=Calcarisporiella thermophila TaxID=911321 RepID=UPI003742E955
MEKDWWGKTALPVQCLASDASPRQVEPRVPVGGRLRKYRNAWRGIPAPLWIRKIIREGYKIQFWKEPRFNHLSPPKRLPADHQSVKAISEEVRSLLEKEAIEEVPRDAPGIVSNIFVISKSSGKLRPVVDLRLLNQSVKKERFKMETLQSILPLIQKDDWLTSIDLKDAFLHVPVHQGSRKYLQFIWGGRKYQFKVLLFGLTSSSRIFTKVLRPVLTVCRKAGIRVAAYLDDLLIAASSIEESKMHTQMLINTLEKFGFVANFEKSTLTPSQEIKHLGFKIHTREMTLNLPRKKVRDISRVALKLYKTGVTTPRQLNAFLRTTNAACPAVMPGRLFARSLMRALSPSLNANPDWDTPFTIPEEALEELDWWAEEFGKWNGRSFLPPAPAESVTTDASDDGWGAQYQSTTIGGPWSPEEKKFHINWKELKTVELCLEAFPSLRETTLLVRTDNTTALAYLNNLGGTRSPRLNEIARKIWTICLERHIQLVAEHIPGHLNNKADTASREIRTNQAWFIDNRAFNKIGKAWGPHSVDLFADRLTNRLPRFFSWHPDTGLTQSVAGTGQADAGDPALAISSLVPPTPTAEHSEASQNSEESDPANHSPNEIPPQDQVVVYDSLAHLGEELRSQGLSLEAQNVILRDHEKAGKRKSYSSAQKKWFEWCKANDVPPFLTPAVAIANFLASQYAQGISADSCHLYRSAIGELQTSHPSHLDSIVARFLRAVDRLAPPLNLAEDPIDITPILEHLRGTPNTELSLRNLTSWHGSWQ